MARPTSLPCVKQIYQSLFLPTSMSRHLYLVSCWSCHSYAPWMKQNNFSSLFQVGTRGKCHIFLHVKNAFPGLSKIEEQKKKQRNRETKICVRRVWGEEWWTYFWLGIAAMWRLWRRIWKKTTIIWNHSRPRSERCLIIWVSKQVSKLQSQWWRRRMKKNLSTFLFLALFNYPSTFWLGRWIGGFELASFLVPLVVGPLVKASGRIEERRWKDGRVLTQHFNFN